MIIEELFFRIAEKRTEREKLLGSSDETKPRIRSPKEIKAKYRKAVVIFHIGCN